MSAEYTIQITDGEVILQPKVHKFTLIWIHGLHESPQMHLRYLLAQPLVSVLTNCRIVLPQAPKRAVTVMPGSIGNSWFDIKFRNEKSFLVDFDEAFSSEEVHESYAKVLKPIIDRENKILSETPDTLMVGGFSQGCGMALHCFYSNPQIQWLGVIGVSGYLFPFTAFNKDNKTPKRIVYGLADPLRPWEFVKVTYQGKFPMEDIVLVEGMLHELKKPETLAQMRNFIHQLTKQ